MAKAFANKSTACILTPLTHVIKLKADLKTFWTESDGENEAVFILKSVRKPAHLSSLKRDGALTGAGN
jgi:hypothetical protein